MGQKLGVYVASYNNPVFLRQCLLQIAAQTRLPDVLAIHENVHTTSYRWVVEDVITKLQANGVEVALYHSPYPLLMPTFFCRPLKALIKAGCEIFNKIDVDDIIYAHHLAVQESLFVAHQPADYVVNTQSELLVLLNKGGYKYSPKVDFGMWNPTGAHPNAIIFNRAVAEAFVEAMFTHAGEEADDAILAKHVFPQFNGKRALYPPTMCYVAHSRTWSTWQWADDPPPEVK
jgi:hypothetical protein